MLSLLLALFTSLVLTPIHTLRYIQAPTFSFTRLPHTQAVAGLADVCPDLLPAQLFSCQCADSEFSTLSYEIRVGDIRASQ